MTRRPLLRWLSGLGLASSPASGQAASVPTRADKLVLSEAEWQKRLSPAQYQVLRLEGTERAGTSPLNDEKRAGTFHCDGCDLPLFSSTAKYDSGTGWPSFFEPLAGALGTKTDFKLLLPRTEYHCARCGGHHGHVFNDGPAPTGQRWCNNGGAAAALGEPNALLDLADQFNDQRSLSSASIGSFPTPCPLQRLQNDSIVPRTRSVG